MPSEANEITDGGMNEKLWEKVWPWIDALKDIDGPMGDYMINLEKRVQLLEKDVSELRGCRDKSV
jgi:hypothetical protein